MSAESSTEWKSSRMSTAPFEEMALKFSEEALKYVIDTRAYWSCVGQEWRRCVVQTVGVNSRPAAIKCCMNGTQSRSS